MDSLADQESDSLNTCRVCLSRNAALLNIFTESSRLGCVIADALVACAPVHISNLDGKPPFICELCHSALEGVRKFQNQVLESDRVLENRFGGLQYDGTGEDCSPDDPNFVFCDVSTFLTPSMQEIDEVKKETVSDDNDDEDEDNSLDIKDPNLVQVKIKEELDADNEENFELASEDESLDFAKKTSGRKRRKKGDGGMAKIYACEMCDKTFTGTSGLLKHKHWHNGYKPYSCDICGRGFGQKIHLTNHKLVHTGERPHKCEHCGKTFALIHNMINHRRIHTGEKPYECEYCCKRFTELNAKKSHRRVHTGERPYSCQICQKTFSSHSGFSNHRRQHEAEVKGKVKPFRCQVCCKWYSTKYVLDRHKCRV